MKFVAEIEMKNSAFVENHDELRRCLADAAESVSEDPAPGEQGTIKDSNGNTVGHWEVTD